MLYWAYHGLYLLSCLIFFLSSRKWKRRYDYTERWRLAIASQLSSANTMLRNAQDSFEGLEKHHQEEHHNKPDIGGEHDHQRIRPGSSPPPNESTNAIGCGG